MEKIKIELTLEQVNLILKALDNMPFKEVSKLIGEINARLKEQSPANPPSDDDEEDSKTIGADER